MVGCHRCFTMAKRFTADAGLNRIFGALNHTLPVHTDRFVISTFPGQERYESCVPLWDYAALVLVGVLFLRRGRKRRLWGRAMALSLSPAEALLRGA